MSDSLIYLHLVDIDDNTSKIFDTYRLLNRVLTRGMIIEQYCKEGYIPFEGIDFTFKEKVFVDKELYEVKIKKLPFVKTHCDHEWINPKPITVSQELIRHCEKCDEEQFFNYIKAKWETSNAKG